MIRVCFVCLGNICRSPTAAGVMQQLVSEAKLDDHVEVDSAGTAAYHTGERPDHRSVAAARRRGIHLPGTARQFQPQDWQGFDYVLAMDRANYEELLRRSPEPLRGKLFLFRDFDSASPDGSSTPDPYYGGPEGFEEVLDVCDAACRGLLAAIRSEHGF